MKKAILLFLVPLAFSQQPQIKPVTPEEESNIYRLQAEIVTAAQDPAVVKYFSLLNEQKKAVEEIYSSRKLEQKEVALCGGPAPGVCAKAPEKHISLQRIETKTEGKK